ncbi:MAG TPA: TonB-dependent receptor [Terriglobales bacterium]|nr:TonB-dependent receptor [Terriglobales bacterium]
MRCQSIRTLCVLSFAFVTAAVCSVLIPARTLAQDVSTAAIRGVIFDNRGAVVRGATVTIVNLSTGVRYAAITNEQGGYFLDLLPPGDYSSRAEAAAMSPEISPNLHLDVGGLTQLDFTLSVAGTKETVTVSGAPPLVETQPSAVSTVLEEAAIQGLPLNGRRFTDLALLAPGVTQDPRGLTSSSNGDLAFGGVRGYQSSYLVDGTDNNNAFFAQARGRYRAPYQFSNEVVQEFRVSSNSYGAELGRAGGGVVNVVTKSGSNHLHGSAFYFLRDSGLSAQQPFVDFKPQSDQHQFGLTLGGPIKTNRAFFFAGFDQHLFYVPALVRFVNGSSTLTPQPAGPGLPGDYEDTDKGLVLAAAAQLSTLTGQFRSKLLGNAGFAKVDLALGPRNFLSARLNTSRYYGANNVFFDPASPVTTFAISNNGEEDVKTESASVSLTSAITPHTTSHLRGQFSRDLQQSQSNSNLVLTRIYSVFDGFGRSTILPRQTREHRLHLAETLSRESSRHSWKLGGDALFTWIYNFFPSLSGGEYYFDNITVNPWTFEPMRQGMKISPLRAYAHAVPRYYMQNLGRYDSHPDTNEYAWFLQDTMRVTSRLGLSLGVRYDLQTFSKAGLISSPLWPDAGKLPNDRNNFAPRVGIAYSIGDRRPLVIRAGYGFFYTRIPQIYTSAVITDNGVTNSNLFLNNSDFYAHQIFPQYPNPLVTCRPTETTCAPPINLIGFATSEISAFSSKFRTPNVQQASVNVERELAHRLAAGISYLHVRGQNLIRARDVNLPAPQQLSYPVFDDTASNLVGYYNVDSFSSWQFSRSMTCPWPPCINPLARPIPQIGAINVFESAGSSRYDGMTISVRRRMTNGVYFSLGYTFAHAIDDGQDALLTGGSLVQNTYSPNSRGPSTTDQRHRLVFSWITEPRPFGREQRFLSKLFNHWRFSGVSTYGSGRPVDARMAGDPNQDGNDLNDRLPGYSRNAFLGPDYATTDFRLARQLNISSRLKIEVLTEAFNAFNRDNQRVDITGDSFVNQAGHFVKLSRVAGSSDFPAYYQRSSNFLRATSAYAPRQLQLGLRLSF